MDFVKTFLSVSLKIKLQKFSDLCESILINRLFIITCHCNIDLYCSSFWPVTAHVTWSKSGLFTML